MAACVSQRSVCVAVAGIWWAKEREKKKFAVVVVIVRLSCILSSGWCAYLGELERRK